jgi:hypothetical protein
MVGGFLSSIAGNFAEHLGEGASKHNRSGASVPFAPRAILHHGPRPKTSRPALEAVVHSRTADVFVCRNPSAIHPKLDLST